jgi:hypothetical protein
MGMVLETGQEDSNAVPYLLKMWRRCLEKRFKKMNARK